MLSPDRNNFHVPRGNEALAIVRAGLRVFPARPGEKLPAIVGWPEKATTDSAVIQRVWSDRDYNPCIATGAYTRIIGGESVTRWLVVLDYDMKPGQLGRVALFEHRQEGWDSSVSITTATGGIHNVFWSDEPIRNSAGRVAANVDVRGERGYVLAATSIIDGAVYVRRGEYADIPDLPEGLKQLIRNSSGSTTSQRLEHNKAPLGQLDQQHQREAVRAYLINEAPEAITGSHGDQTTFQVACRCKDLGVSEDVCLELMWGHWNTEKAFDPWTFDELRTKVSNAYRYGRNPPGSADARIEFGVDDENSGDNSPKDTQQAPVLIPTRSPFPLDVKDIPPRDWVVPGLLLKKATTLLVAPPGSGKSMLTLQLAIMVATGMSWGGWNPRQCQKVLIVNTEDDEDEMNRRLYVALAEMGVDHADVADRIEIASAPESIVIAKLKPNSRVIVRAPLLENLVHTIKTRGIGFTVVDPFAETFEGDENNNSEIKWVGTLWREVVRRTNSTLALVHHTPKYSGEMAGNADASRGGGSLIGVTRILCTLFTMTETEAKAMGVVIEERFDYVRFDDAKANYSRLGAVRWFKKKDTVLDNARGTIPGDQVGVLVPWKPDLMEGITEAVLGDLRDTIDAGVLNEHNKPSGSFFALSAAGRNSERWIGNTLMTALGCDEIRVKAILKDWTAKGWIEVFEYVDPNQRKARTGVRCNAANWPKIEAKNE